MSDNGKRAQSNPDQDQTVKGNGGNATVGESQPQEKPVWDKATQGEPDPAIADQYTVVDSRGGGEGDAA